jgi:uncharacterized protein
MHRDNGTPDPDWPHRSLDVDGLQAIGWRPTPFRDYVLKVHQRCNLACDYCYVYAMADQTWRSRPRVMTTEVAREAARRIAEHVLAHQLRSIRIIMHGGEPLLAGRERLVLLTKEIRTTIPADCHVEFTMQSNGILLDDAILDMLHIHSITMGVSLDGSAVDNDRHRRGHDGRGSFAACHRAIERLSLPENRSAFAGLLCTVDIETDPLRCYDALLRYSPPAVDFLLPHANWSTAARPAATGPAYAQWLIAIFDRWYETPVPSTGIRLFEDIISLALGGSSSSEQVGLGPVGVVVIETDGAIEQVDSLKSAYAGACATGLSVQDNTLDEALSHPGVVARQIGVRGLSEACRACPIHRICGGGHYAHRYRSDNGFRNPSVYCDDLRQLIDHIVRRVTMDLSRRLDLLSQ